MWCNYLTMFNFMAIYLTTIEVIAWMNDYINNFYVDVIIYPCSEFNAGLLIKDSKKMICDHKHDCNGCEIIYKTYPYFDTTFQSFITYPIDMITNTHL